MAGKAGHVWASSLARFHPPLKSEFPAMTAAGMRLSVLSSGGSREVVLGVLLEWEQNDLRVVTMQKCFVSTGLI